MGTPPLWPPLGGGEVSRSPPWGAALVGAEIVWAPPGGWGGGGGDAGWRVEHLFVERVFVERVFVERTFGCSMQLLQAATIADATVELATIALCNRCHRCRCRCRCRYPNCSFTMSGTWWKLRYADGMKNTHTHQHPTYSREAVLSDYERPLPKRSTATEAIEALLAATGTMVSRRNGIDAEALSDLLASVSIEDMHDTLAAHGLTVDDMAQRLVDIAKRPASYGYLQPDPALYVMPSVPFDPTWTRPRVAGPLGVAVRGRRNGYVIDGNGNRADYSDALAVANDMLRANPVAVIDDNGNVIDETYNLIGTDSYSWAAVIDHRPDLIDSAYGLLPERPSHVAGTGSARAARRIVLTRPVYGGRVALPAIDADGNTIRNKDGRVRTRTYRAVAAPDEIMHNGWWPLVGHRVVKRYRTTYNGRYVIGHGRWSDVKVSGSKRVAKRPHVQTVAVGDTATAIDAIEAKMVAAYESKKDAKVSLRLPNGTTIRAAHEPSKRRFRTAVSFRGADGKVTNRVESTYSDLYSMTAALAVLCGQ